MNRRTGYSYGVIKLPTPEEIAQIEAETAAEERRREERYHAHSLTLSLRPLARELKNVSRFIYII